MTLLAKLFGAALLLAATPVSAADDPALGGLDPVALADGDERAGQADLSERWGRHLYCFESEASRATFLRDPERWAIQWGGGCGRMGPLSGRGNPDRWAVYRRRIYIFASDACREGFLAEPERYAPTKRAPIPTGERARSAGTAWIERVVAAHGGATAIDGASELRLGRERETDGWEHRDELVLSSDGGVHRRSLWIPPDEGEASIATSWTLAQKEAFTIEDGSRFELASSAERDDARRLAHREPLALLWARHAPDFEAVWLGRGDLGETPVVDVRVRVSGLSTVLHLDAASARIVGLSWRGRLGDGVTREVVEVFSDWRELAGVTLPAARDVRLDGEPSEARSMAWGRIELHGPGDARAGASEPGAAPADGTEDGRPDEEL